LFNRNKGVLTSLPKKVLSFLACSDKMPTFALTMENIIVGLDAKRIVRNGTGLGSYGRTLVNDLSAIGDLSLRLYAPDSGRDDLRGQVVESDRLCFCYPRGWQPLGKSYWRTRGMVSQLRSDGVQVYHGLSGELPMGLAKAGIRSVVTVHDLIFLRHPEWYNAADVKIYTRKLHYAVENADCIVAISECTRRDVLELGGADAERVKVVYQSCSPRFALAATPVPDKQTMNHVWYVRDLYGLPDRYVLSVGSIEERKNILLAVKALEQLPDDLSLVVVGRATAYSDEVWQYTREHGLAGRVVILHGVPDDHLPPIYRLAEAFVYPSRYEGFGIPIIEAISMGLPVVACTGSCLEEAGGPHCIYVDPDDETAMADALSKVLCGAEGREQRIELSRQYIRKFENNDAATRIAEIYRSLVRG
jgi:glycosyltransferase involved in cell wall biosynthesis